jgi:hypothetical protein
MQQIPVLLNMHIATKVLDKKDFECVLKTCNSLYISLAIHNIKMEGFQNAQLHHQTY